MFLPDDKEEKYATDSQPINFGHKDTHPLVFALHEVVKYINDLNNAVTAQIVDIIYDIDTNESEFEIKLSNGK